MAIFNFAPTAHGKVLFADVQAGAVLIPTRFVIGTGSVPSGIQPKDMVGVVSPLKDLAVTKRKRTPDGMCIFGCVFSNEDITEDFYLREIALYARAEYRDDTGAVTKAVDEVCLIYGNAGDTADEYPAYSTATVVERSLEIVSYVGADAQVDMTIPSGAYAAFDENGNVHLYDGRITGLGDPVDLTDAVNKQYADTKLPKSGGQMTGPIDMNAQRITGLPDPAENHHPVTLGYAAYKFGTPANLLVNSDFTNPVNRKGQSYYYETGETIDQWINYYGAGLGVEADCVNLRSEAGDRGEIYQPIDPTALVVGKTYTAAIWYTNGVCWCDSITVGENQMVEGAESGQVWFGISTISGRTGLFLFFNPGTSVRVKYVALYESRIMLDDLPEYRPNGRRNEVAACVNSMFESVDHPGCLYRLAGGVVEWINPPMVAGVEYKTTKRHSGKPVYTKLIDYGVLKNASVSLNITGTVISFTGNAFTSGTVDPFPIFSSGGELLAVAYVKNGSICVNVFAQVESVQKFTAQFVIEYTK